MATNTDSSQIMGGYDEYPTKNVHESFLESPEGMNHESESDNFDSALCIVDLDKVKKQYELWHECFGGKIMPFYAVKCNPDPEIIKSLALLGAGFDCASKPEIETVLQVGNDLKTELGCSYMRIGPERIGFFHPCKMRSHLIYAREMGVRKMTFDSINELEKIADIYFGVAPKYEQFYNPEILLRIKVDDISSQSPLSNKFGAESNAWKSLLLKAYELQLNVVGVAFHVGSGCTRADSFTEAFNDTERVFELAQILELEIKAKKSQNSKYENNFDTKLYFHSMNVIDIGGGFPGDAENKNFPAMVKFINDFINGDWCKQWVEKRRTEGIEGYELTFIAEPGRFFAHQSTTLITNVVGIKMCQEDELITTINYYLNDGLYGSFNDLVYSHATIELPLYDHNMMLKNITKNKKSKSGLVNNTNERNGLKNLFSAKENDSGLKIEDKRQVVLSRFFGPTCDGFDVIMEGEFPLLKEGEHLIWPDMGAYKQAAASRFNGFEPPAKIYLNKPSEK